ncbi:hypothetical protein [Tenacibaculum sp. M341]|uniref:hypothetical protein n=1 Tax=Tenacibaculum sp. M341 TaxID=2530339 RepID=UPI0010539065|nr:hypothetical protein [Tenacibaculum sp. M341]TCI90019.1 hypothetical protein EYW44_15245 [Tenacibaculum sp. M341]
MGSFKNYSLLVFVLFFISCNTNNSHNTKFQFYHWKANATLSNKEKEALNTVDNTKIFIHYFDVVVSDDIARPVAVLQNMDTVFQNKKVVPVVFIRNSVFKNDNVSVDQLVVKIKKLVQQIHHKYLGENTDEIQIDCDWSGSTKEKYFQFLEVLEQQVKTSVTIRLHQIKYKDKTGVPPVNYGVLMLYNVGDLSDFKQNSILKNTTVKQYVNNSTNYPLSLDVALPMFSQVVVKNNEGRLRLINRAVTSDFDKDTVHFDKISTNLYKVKEKLLYRGQYLYKDFLLKIEKSELEETLKSYQVITKSKLEIKNIILYHLDEEELGIHNYQELISRLQQEKE